MRSHLTTVAGVVVGALALWLVPASTQAGVAPIDRHALVARHNLELVQSEAVQVGNGQFAFTADLTGLQTFEPHCTMSHWGWHSAPLPADQQPEDFRWTAKPTQGRTVEYPIGTGDALSRWLYANPHRLNLGRLALRLTKLDGTAATRRDLMNARQQLNLWSGLLTSRFEVEGQVVQVETCVHPVRDAVAVRIRSPLLALGRLRVELAFPYPDLKEFGGYGDWERPAAHQTRLRRAEQRGDFQRQLDGDSYAVRLAWSQPAELLQPAPHTYTLRPTAEGSLLEFVCAFSPVPDAAELPSFPSIKISCGEHWARFWNSGGAIDLSGSKDPRWMELERRLVLSQYLMAVNEAGSLPPQESGLVNNGWNGKFHWEMYWWHAAHYALWDRWPLLERSLGCYPRGLPAAREKARRQGYPGARWPKCTGPEGRESPHPIHALLLWQQPHPLFFAELDYRAHPTPATLEKWREVVQETADFMAAYATLEPDSGHYSLGPPLYVVSENTDPETTRNPAFELAYWRFGLRVAQTWRERSGQTREAGWDRVLTNLAPLPQSNGVYVLHEGVRDMWTQWNWEHPALTGLYGWLPGDGVELETMRRTFQKVRETWRFDRTWGWDFPMLAMAAARLGDPEGAVNFLLHPAGGFQFNAVGLATGGPFPYFPSNGGLLYAAAMMAAGWDGAPARSAPGFPGNGQWVVRWEGLKPAP